MTNIEDVKQIISCESVQLSSLSQQVLHRCHRSLKDYTVWYCRHRRRPASWLGGFSFTLHHPSSPYSAPPLLDTRSFSPRSAHWIETSINGFWRVELSFDFQIPGWKVCVKTLNCFEERIRLSSALGAGGIIRWLCPPLVSFDHFQCCAGAIKQEEDWWWSDRKWWQIQF